MTLPANGNAPLNNPSHFDEHVSLPRGIVAYKFYTATVTTTSTPTECFRLNTVALKAGRLYVLTFVCRALQLGSATGAFHFGCGPVAGTSLTIDTYAYSAGGIYTSAMYQGGFTVTSDGTFTFVITGDTTVSSTAFPTFVRIEDIGPVRGGQ